MRGRKVIPKIGLALLLSSCGLGGIEARAVEDWVSVVGGTGERWGRDVAFTANEDVVLVGAFDADAVFDAGLPTEVTLTSTGGWNSYIAKYQRDGDFEWAVAIEGSDVFVQAVAVDDRNTIAVAGYTPGSALFRFPDGSTETVAPPPGAIEAGFVAVFDRNGELLWIHQLLGDEIVQPLDVDFDHDGNVVAAGTFQGSAMLGSLPVHSENSNGFVLIYSEDGAVLSEFETTTDSPSSFATIWSVACFSRGNVLITGDFQGTVAVGRRTLVSKQGSEDVFCARFSSGDGVLWARGLGGPGLDTVFGADVNEGDETVLAGKFEGSAGLDGGNEGTFILQASGTEDGFVATFDPEGTFLWAQAIGGTGSTAAYAVTIGRDMDVTVTGSFDGTLDFAAGLAQHRALERTPGGRFDAYLAHYDRNGAFDVAFQLAGSGEEFGMGSLFVDRAAVLVSGAATSEATLQGPSTLNGRTIPVTGDRAAFVMRITRLRATQASSP